MGLEFNATLIAQIIDLLIFVLITAGILTAIYQALSFKNSIDNKIKKMDKELRELKEVISKRQG